MLEKKDLEMIAEVVSETVKELNEPINARLDKMDARFDQMDARFDQVDTRLDQVDARLDKVDTRLDQVDARLDKVDTRLDKVDARLDKVEGKVTEIQMTLENETNKEIMIIAEGHLDLSRKLDDALRVETEREMLLLRVSRLESDVRKLKQQVNGSA